MAAINTKRPVRFNDDRGKEKTMFLLKEVLFEDDDICLCVIGLEKDTGDQILDKNLKVKVLFEIKTFRKQIIKQECIYLMNLYY